LEEGLESGGGGTGSREWADAGCGIGFCSTEELGLHMEVSVRRWDEVGKGVRSARVEDEAVGHV